MKDIDLIENGRSQFVTSKSDNSQITSKIVIIRDIQLMIDRDIAELYGVETKRLNEQVKHNAERFPDQFMFQLDDEEFSNWKSQFVTLNTHLTFSASRFLRAEPLGHFGRLSAEKGVAEDPA